MTVAVAYIPEEEDLFTRWLAWCARLGCGQDHHLLVLPFKGIVCPPITSWKQVTVLKDYSGVRSDWRKEGAVRDASGPNFAFREMANHVHQEKLGPFLWMESDAAFLTSDAVSRIERDYAACGRRFMGALVESPETPRHMSGIAVYPETLAISASHYMQPRLAEINGRTVEAAFNLAGAPDALADFAPTRLIQQEFRPPVFTSRKESEALIENGRVVFHMDKAGVLMTLLSASSIPSTGASCRDLVERIAAESSPRLAHLLGEKSSPDSSTEVMLKERVRLLESLIIENGIAESICNPDGPFSRASKAAKKAKMKLRMEKARSAKKK